MSESEVSRRPMSQPSGARSISQNTDGEQTVLAVETSGVSGQLALKTANGQIAEADLSQQGRRHAQTLVSEVDQLLKSADLLPSEIDLVAVSQGPGSFTGLRVGIVFAKTFAWANAAQLVAVDTLQVLASQVPDSASTVSSIIDAQRKEVFINCYGPADASGCRSAQNQLRIIPVSDLKQGSGDADTDVLTGPALAAFPELADRFSVASQSLWQPTASMVLKIGEAIAKSGQFANMASLEPVYVRRSYAEEKKQA